MNNLSGQLQQKIEQVLDNPPASRTVIVQVPMEHALEINASLMLLLQARGFTGIYVTLEKSFPEITLGFVKKNIKVEQIHFIDCISDLYGYGKNQAKNVTYLRGPLDLKGLSDHLGLVLNSMNAEKTFIFIDSLTSLMLYNQVDKMVDFIRQLNSLITQKNALAFAAMLCDHHVKATIESALEKETVNFDLRGESD